MRSAASWPPLTSGARLPLSTVGTTPPGVATTTSWPAASNASYGATASSAQNPLGWRVPSASVQWSTPVITKRIFDMVRFSEGARGCCR